MEHTYTLQSLRDAVYGCLDELSHNGDLPDRTGGGLADLEKRFLPAVNRAMRRLYLSCGKQPKTTTCAFYRPHLLTSWRSLVFDCPSMPLPMPDGAASFSFVHSGSGTLSFYDEGELISTKVLTSDDGILTVCKGLIPADATAMCFDPSGGTLIVERLCIFEAGLYADASDERLLPTDRYLFCRFPSGAFEISGIRRLDSGLGIPSDPFSFGDGVISCPVYLDGEYEISYAAYPAPFTASSPDTTPVELPPQVSDALVYAAAIDLCPPEDGERYIRLCRKLDEVEAHLYSDSALHIKNRFPVRRPFRFGRAFGG